MGAVLNRFSEASGFPAVEMQALISMGGVFFLSMWAIWSLLGQFQLWARGDISIGQILFGSMRVIGVMIGVIYVLSMTV